MFQFHKHHNYEGRHAILSPSNHAWINYDEQKLRAAYEGMMARENGTQLHALASELIRLRVKLPRTKQTLNMYVNDCIGYGLAPEQVLVYSDNCFGTADAIGVKNNSLLISDLKTGVTKASFDQLKIYAALFCLEYNITPLSLSDIQLRIYQSNEIRCELAELYEIADITEKIKYFDEIIDSMKEV